MLIYLKSKTHFLSKFTIKVKVRLQPQKVIKITPLCGHS